jgi:transposase
MIIIGCDFHTRYQQIAMAREETGEVLVERRLDHESGEAHAFYRSLQSSQELVRVGIEATGPIHWFERLLAELGHELRIGDSAKIRASEVRKQKTDERDARLILDLLLAKRFPEIWVPTPAERDLRQLLWHRHKLVCLRTMLGNQLHFLAMSQGLCRKKKLFTKKGRAELAGLALGPWTRRRREELLQLLDQLEPAISELDRAVLEQAQRRGDAVLLMTHPGIEMDNLPRPVLAGTLHGFQSGSRNTVHGTQHTSFFNPMPEPRCVPADDDAGSALQCSSRCSRTAFQCKSPALPCPRFPQAPFRPCEFPAETL